MSPALPIDLASLEILKVFPISMPKAIRTCFLVWGMPKDKTDCGLYFSRKCCLKVEFHNFSDHQQLYWICKWEILGSCKWVKQIRIILTPKPYNTCNNSLTGLTSMQNQVKCFHSSFIYFGLTMRIGLLRTV